MGYDVTNNTSTIELVSGAEIPIESDLIPIVLPESPLLSPNLIGVDAIAPVGEIVELPDSIPSPELIGTDAIAPVGDMIEIPITVPPDGIILLETIPIPADQVGVGTGVVKLIELHDVNTTRSDGDMLVYNADTGDYVHTQPAALPPPLTFATDITVILSAGKSLGKYIDGDTIPAIGLTASEVLLDIALEYINAVFTSFNITSQSNTVEVGTTLSGNKTFTWNITENSGDVLTIDIYDITDSSDIATATDNDGTEPVTINTFQLNAEGVTQQWRGIGTDIIPDPDVDFNSSVFTVTGRFYRFYGPTSSSPTNSAGVRALPSSAFHYISNVFNLETGIIETIFVVALPPGYSISEIIDLDALNANITSEYILQTSINVIDAGGTPRAYNIYEMNVGIPYSSNHRHQITTA